MKFEDGSEITSQDVKYAVERSNFAPEALSNGPTYFKAYLDGGDKYKGPYKDKSTEGLKSIETPPDKYTIVFHLNKPFADMDYLAAFSQTAPIQQKADTGASYVQKMVSSGPYKFSAYDESKGATLVRNPQWDPPKTDPIRKALPDKIQLKFNVNPPPRSTSTSSTTRPPRTSRARASSPRPSPRSWPRPRRRRRRTTRTPAPSSTSR